MTNTRSRLAALTLLVFTQACGLTLLSADEEISMGLDAYPQAVASHPEIKTGADYELLQRVMKRLAPYAARDVGTWTKRRFDWEVKLLDAPGVVNAWCLPGGKMAFYTGILPICEGEDGVAVVMSHEIAHAVKRHGNQRMSQDLILKGILTAGEIAIADGDDRQSRENNEWIFAALGVGIRYGVKLPYSRSHESEADAYGLELLAQAGYDLEESARLWDRMAARGGGGPEFLSTHPNPSNRARALRELIPEVRAKYPTTVAGTRHR